MVDLRLAKLPDRTPIKLGIAVSPDLNEALQQYLALYCSTYADASATVADLIPAMLTAFLASDRAFVRATKQGGQLRNGPSDG